MPSASMYPTLKVGDYFLVSKLSYDYSKHSFNFSIVADGKKLVDCCSFDFPGRVVLADTHKRGDVAVFMLPTNTEIGYIKRVIGLPGDRIQMKDGVVFVNGEAAPKVRVDDYIDTEGNGVSGGQPAPQYEEMLPNGVKYRVLDLQPRGGADNTIVYVATAAIKQKIDAGKKIRSDDFFENWTGSFTGSILMAPPMLAGYEDIVSCGRLCC